MKDLKVDFSCGVVPITTVDGRREYLLVQHGAGHWAFPKGHPEGEETWFETAERELAEETGLINPRLLKVPAFEEHYVFNKRGGAKVEKHVVYYLGRVAGKAVRLQEEELTAWAWGDAEATAARMTFDEGRALLAEVERFLARGGGEAIGL
jgi:8-oxo-dGTP pyrophosphatase MutT (NUDIX family)